MMNSPDFILPSRDVLRQALSATAEVKQILTEDEQKKINFALEALERAVLNFEKNKILARQIMDAQKKSDVLKIDITLRDSATGLVKPAQPKDFLDECRRFSKSTLEYIQFLRPKASALLIARQFVAAENILAKMLNYGERVFGKDHVETLRTEFDYLTTCSHGTLTERRVIDFRDLLSRVSSQLKDDPNNVFLKRTCAMTHYTLGQYEFIQGNSSLALNHLEQSKQLRESYQASEDELDRIRFLQSQIFYNDRQFEKGLKLMKACYDFRYSQDPLNPHLIPVLVILSDIMEKQKNQAAAFQYLTRSLKIHRHLQLPPRQIIAIQLQLLRVMAFMVPTDEYWEVMTDIEEELNALPIIQENVEVGKCYIELIEAKTKIFLPQDWSQTRKRQFYSEVLKLAHKADLHLNAASHSNDVRLEKGRLDSLREKAQLAVTSMQDLRVFQHSSRITHPDDLAEIALFDKLDADKTGDAPEAILDDPQEPTSTLEHLASLSTFSSEVDHLQVPVPDRFLTIQEFAELPDSGRINPYRLRVAQGGINPEFRDQQSLDTMKTALVADPQYAQQIPPVEIGVYKEKVYSFDTRRLITHQQAREGNPNVEIRYQKISGARLQDRIHKIFSPRPWNGIVTALRFGGVNSPSEPYINPALRPQLEERVNKKFKPYPSKRSASADDPNGFPVKEKKADKIYRFFQKRAARGSLKSQEIIAKTSDIANANGKEAALDFLLAIKTSS